MGICKECPSNSDNVTPKAPINHCTICKCPLKTKTKALTGSCPIGNWAAILTPEDKEKMEELIKTKNHEGS